MCVCRQSQFLCKRTSLKMDRLGRNMKESVYCVLRVKTIDTSVRCKCVFWICMKDSNNS